MRQELIEYLITKKDNLINDVNSLLFAEYFIDSYEPLTENDINKIIDLRKDIYEIYSLIDILNEKEND